MKKKIALLLVIFMSAFVSAHADVIIDNGETGTSSAGTWYNSGGADPYGATSRFSGQAGATYTYQAPLSGSYEVSLWWTVKSNRCDNVAVDIYDGASLVDTVYVDQLADGGRWNDVPDTYTFSTTARVVINSGGGCTTCADAVKFVSSASGARTLDRIAIEGPLSVNENSSSDYSSRAFYTDGTSQLVESGSWDVNCPAYGLISATGLFTADEVSADTSCRISASYSEGGITRGDTHDITIKNIVAAAETIIDNGQTGTSSAGLWRRSGAANSYGTASFYSAESGATYSYEATLAGEQRVSLWWTQYSNRCSNVAVDIYDGASLLDTVYVDHTADGGRWNDLPRSYAFSGAARVVINSQGGCTTSADAVKFVSSASGARTLDRIAIEGPLSVNENSSSDYSSRAFYTDGTSQLVESGSWDVNCPAYGLISATGLFTADEVSADTSCRISASYSEGGITRGDTHDITIKNIVAAAETIIDNGQTGTSSAGLWRRSGAANSYGTASFYSAESGATYSYEATLAGEQRVSLWWTQYSNRCSNVAVDIYDGASLLDTVYVDHTADGGRWNDLPRSYAFSGAARVVVNSQGGCTTCADAVMFSAMTETAVQITFPDDYYLQRSTSLSAKASAQNLMTGWGIKFISDRGTAAEKTITDNTAPFQVQFNNLALSEHTVDAYVVDTLGNNVAGVFTQDHRIQIAIGDYLVGVGDSITDGFGGGSVYTSADGRNSGTGYEPVLNDLLTDALGIPHNVSNEGVGGDKSADGVAIISQIIADHPEASKLLVEYGTNDGALMSGVPSGLGLNKGDGGYPGTFKDNMQRIIDAINTAGKRVCLARLPIVLGDTVSGTRYSNPLNPPFQSKGYFVQQYNLVIDELVANAANNILVSPDFYSLFVENVVGGRRYEFEYADNLHPNTQGYQSMATLWSQILTTQ